MEIVRCPECGTKLKLKSIPSPGMSIECPRCSASFAPGEEEGKEPRPLARTTASKPKAVRRREVAEEEDDEAEDRPARPRRGGKRTARKGGSTGWIVALVLGGGLLLMCGVGVTLLVVFWPFGSSLGGGSQNQQEAAHRDMIKLYEEAGDAFESVRDQASAQVVAARHHQIADRMEALDKQMKSLPRITPEEEARLAKAIGPEMARVTGRVSVVGAAANRNSAGDPTFAAAMKRFHEADARLQGNK